MADEILSEILLSLLSIVENESIKFDLHIPNCSLLDDTWTLPTVKRYEFVPCDRLGVLFKGEKNVV